MQPNPGTAPSTNRSSSEVLSFWSESGDRKSGRYPLYFSSHSLACEQNPFLVLKPRDSGVAAGKPAPKTLRKENPLLDNCGPKIVAKKAVSLPVSLSLSPSLHLPLGPRDRDR